MTALTLEQVGYKLRPHFWTPEYVILKGVSLSVEQGEIFGFLGPNGAGKTTTIRAVLGLIRASGKISVLGGEISDISIRKRIGFMPERAHFPDHLSGRELVTLHGILCGYTRGESMRRADETLDRVGLRDASNKKIREYSKGMVQRAGIAQALVGDPELVILDEPMSGLDPLGRRDVREVMTGLRDEGKTVFFSTHILPDVEMICDRVGILVDGVIQKQGQLAELVGDHVARVEVTALGCTEDVLTSLEEVTHERDYCDPSWRIVVSTLDEGNRVIDLLRQHGATVVDVRTHRGGLETVFVDELQTREGDKS